MSDSKHTPGPWMVFDTPIGLGVSPVAFGGDIAKCNGFDSKRSDDEERANAHLIAAAPDMLEALQEVIEYSGGADHALLDEYVVARIFAAIAKVEGRS